MRGWAGRQKNILEFTLSSLARRKRKNAALLAVYTLVVLLLGSVMFFTRSLRREAGIVLGDAPEMVVQRLAAGRPELIPESYLERIRGIPGVVEARPRLWGYYFDPTSGANYTLVVPVESAPADGTIRVGEGVARARLAVAGDTIEFRARDGAIVTYEVGGLLSPASSLESSDLIVISEADFRRLFGIPAGQVTDLALRVANSRELSTIAVKIAEALPDTRQVLRDEIQRTYDAVFNWRGGLLLVILAGAVLAFIILAWDKASGLSAEERREIGILKGIGWETSDVIWMKFWEGTAVSLTSFLTGTLLAYVHVFFFSARLFEPVLKGWAVLYPRFKVIPYINGAELAALFFLTVVPYTVATVIPSWRAAIADPDAVMR
jgi:hypothetical protein